MQLQQSICDTVTASKMQPMYHFAELKTEAVGIVNNHERLFILYIYIYKCIHNLQYNIEIHNTMHIQYTIVSI